MPRPRPCLGLPGTHCPQLTTNRRGRCDHCQRQADRRRGTSTERGYDADHRRLREQLEPIVAAGQAICWRCGNRIQPGTPWDLGHSDTDRRVTRGPEHAACNRATSQHRREREWRTSSDRAVRTAKPPALAWFDTSTSTSRNPLPRRQIRHTPGGITPTRRADDGRTFTIFLLMLVNGLKFPANFRAACAASTIFRP